jgi:GT2 family glycosyltransferase
MSEISFVIPSYNNLRYLKNVYRSIRTHCGDERHEIIVLDDASTDGTIEWLRSLKDQNLTIWTNDTGERYGHTITYNIGVRIAKNPIFSILHADMFVGPNYVKNILKHLDRGKVVSATRIEPPLHPSGKEKITKDFGMWPEDFKENDFLEFVDQEQQNSKDKTTRGIFAPWAMYREDFLSIGGHDPLFAPFPYEDSDIFQRFILAGYEIIQSRDSLVYHLTCRGHKWTDNDELGKVDDSFEAAEIKARKNYIRKWNSWIGNDEYGYPILYPKYDVGLIVKIVLHKCYHH